MIGTSGTEPGKARPEKGTGFIPSAGRMWKRRCKTCGEPFKTTHGFQKHCDECRKGRRR